MTGHGGMGNALAGDFGEMWVHVVAAGSGLLHGGVGAAQPTTLDFEKADVELVIDGEVAGTYNPRVKVQVKTTQQLRDTDDGTALVYSDLDVATYDFLRRPNHSVGRTLVVIELSDPDERVRLHEDGTLLVGRGAWVSLQGSPPTTNTSSVTVTLPRTNTLDREGLWRMITEHGVRRSSIVTSGEADPWPMASGGEGQRP